MQGYVQIHTDFVPKAPCTYFTGINRSQMLRPSLCEMEKLVHFWFRASGRPSEAWNYLCRLNDEKELIQLHIVTLPKISQYSPSLQKFLFVTLLKSLCLFRNPLILWCLASLHLISSLPTIASTSPLILFLLCLSCSIWSNSPWSFLPLCIPTNNRDRFVKTNSRATEERLHIV